MNSWPNFTQPLDYLFKIGVLFHFSLWTFSELPYHLIRIEMVEDILIPSCPPVLWSLVSDCQEAYDNREDPEGRREVLILDMPVAQIIGRLLHRKTDNCASFYRSCLLLFSLSRRDNEVFSGIWHPVRFAGMLTLSSRGSCWAWQIVMTIAMLQPSPATTR